MTNATDPTSTKTPTGDVCLYRSSLIDASVFFHGWPERTGGYSTGLRTSLSLNSRTGDDADVVVRNRHRVGEVAGFDASKFVVTKHVHGNAVWTVGESELFPHEFDGLVTDRPGVVLGAFAADCVPIVFGDPVGRIAGAAHAGWRGTVTGVAARVIDAMVAKGASVANTRVALGPCIGPCCFEVGDEVVAEFVRALGQVDGLIVKGPRRSHIDLRLANRTVLERAGVAPHHIDDTPPCTMCYPERFFSYRREGAGGGVHMGFIGLR